VDMSTPLWLEVDPEIDTNPTRFYRGRGRGGSLRLQTPALAMSVHPTYFDLATPLGAPRPFRRLLPPPLPSSPPPSFPFSLLLPCPALPEARLAPGSDPRAGAAYIRMLYRAIDAAHIVCTRSGVRPSVCLSVPPTYNSSEVWLVCCYKRGRLQQI